MTSTLRFSPIKTGYSAEEMPGLIEIPLEGGGSRKRQDILLPGHIINCQWLLSASEYTEFMGFFVSELRYGRDDFLMDLITDVGVPTTHLCRTIGGLPKLTQQKYDGYWVSCVLECDKNPTFTSQIVYSIGEGASWIFDGIDDNILVDDTLHFERNQAFSLSAIINASSSTTGNRQIIANCKNDSTGRGYAFEIRVNSPVSGLFLELNNNSNANTNCLKRYVPSSTFNLLDGSNHKVVVTYDGSSTASGVKFYIDGTLYASTAFGTNTLSATIVPSAGTNLRIGGRDASGFYHEGLIQNAAIWSSVLSAAQVTELDSPGVILGGLTSHSAAATLELWYKIIGTDATGAGGVIDHSGNGLDGTAENGLGSGGPGQGQIVFSGIGRHFQEGDRIRVLNSSGVHPDGNVPLNLDGIYTVEETVVGGVVLLDDPAAVNTDWNTLYDIDPSAEYGGVSTGNVLSTVTKVPQE